MTYKLLRHKDLYGKNEEPTPIYIRDPNLKEETSQSHRAATYIFQRIWLRGDLMRSCYKIRLLKAGVRLVYQVKDDQVVIPFITVGKNELSTA